MFNKSLSQTGKDIMPRKIIAVNVFGIVKETDGDNITFYEGWNPKERGELIKNKFFESVNNVQL